MLFWSTGVTHVRGEIRRSLNGTAWEQKNLAEDFQGRREGMTRRRFAQQCAVALAMALLRIPTHDCSEAHVPSDAETAPRPGPPPPAGALLTRSHGPSTHCDNAVRVHDSQLSTLKPSTLNRAKPLALLP